MGSVTRLGELIGCPDVVKLDRVPADCFDRRNEIKQILAAHLGTESTEHWLSILEPADFWCSDVYNYGRLMEHAGYKAVEMEQVVRRPNGTKVRTTRCPIRIDGKLIFSDRAAPVLGDANKELVAEAVND